MNRRLQQHTTLSKEGGKKNILFQKSIDIKYDSIHNYGSLLFMNMNHYKMMSTVKGFWGYCSSDLCLGVIQCVCAHAQMRTV